MQHDEISTSGLTQPEVERWSEPDRGRQADDARDLLHGAVAQIGNQAAIAGQAYVEGNPFAIHALNTMARMTRIAADVLGSGDWGESTPRR